MDNDPDRPEVTVPRLHRIDHPTRIIVWAVVLLLALTSSFLVGRFLQAPEREQLAQAQQEVPVLVPVENRVVDSRVSYFGKVIEGTNLALSLQSLPDPAVVTRQPLKPGDAVTPGALIGAISGQPVFALAGPLALYRNLATGDIGDDVKSLQQTLQASGYNVEVTGWVDWQTTVVIDRLFTDNGFPRPTALTSTSDGGDLTENATRGGGTVIPFMSFVAMGTSEAIVATALPVGAKISAESPLVTVKIQPNYVSFRADATQIADLVIGQKLTLQSAEQQMEGTIEAIGEFTAGSEGQTPGRDISVFSPDTAFSELQAGSSVTLLPEGEHEESLAVPLVSVRQDAGGTYVLRATGSDRSEGEFPTERIKVTVKYSGGGWAALEDGALSIDDEVVAN